MIPLVGIKRRARGPARGVRRGRDGGHEGDGCEGAVPRRDDDRGARARRSSAGEIAEHAEFFSFGTNDLTQMTYAFSRDDAEGKFLADYLEKGILEVQPLRDARPHRCRPPRRARDEGGTRDESEAEGRRLRRARRGSVVGRVLRERRARLRLLLALPCADRPAGCGAGGTRRSRRGEQMTKRVS